MEPFDISPDAVLVKCDEAKPACLRCTSTGRKCEGYAVVVPSNRAIARARSRTTRLKDALAQARATWEGGSEKTVLEHFTRDVAPMLPANLENQFLTVFVPRMTKSEPAVRHAMTAIGGPFPQPTSSNPSDGGTPQADEHYARALRLLCGRNTRSDKDAGDDPGKGNGDTKPFNIPAAAMESPGSLSSPARSSAGPSSAVHSPAAPASGISSIPEVAEADRSEHHASTNSFASPQSQEDDGDEEPAVHNDVDMVLFCCILFTATEFLRGNLENAMRHVASGINILNNVEHDELDQTTKDEIIPTFHRLSIIQLCYYDKPGFPTLRLQHGQGSRYDLGPFNKSSSIYLPQRAADPIILDAIRYIRAAGPESQTDSRLASKGPVMSDEQKNICAALDKWHAAFLAFVDFPRKSTDPPLPKHKGLICAEAEMKYQTAKICVCVCRSHDESVYDCFKDFFRRIMNLARLILDSCPDGGSDDATQYKFDFEVSYLPLLEFVIAKCRWLDIRYQAWLLVWELATARTETVTFGRLHLVGRRMIEKEHNVSIDEVTKENAHLFSLPAEEMRVKDYAADPRFADLLTAEDVDMDGPSRIHVPYNQRLLLRCGSYELDELAGWIEGERSPLP
ncbi:hypothetical protein CCHL11_08285 [Colletotrichum chlorophyti]|uniref:Zn(2)-C6 fungal-type domain-containing protein n=1 Tax=Colletotrichum chlorophyti TaxID=708187 RepID=A0A1Q8RMY2_9PEZI|nr:hypothetical protein CCHL11_08285 [Colletotrichum chlorophyti]